MLRMRLRCVLVQGLELSGGLTSSSVFPKTEEKLNSTEYQAALKFVAKRKNMERYWSVMDFLFCESFPEWRFHARRFYNGNGPPLIDDPQFSDEKQKMYDVLLCDGVLELCIASLKSERWIAWNEMLNIFEKRILAA